MSTRRKPGGYAARQRLVTIRQTHAAMVRIARRMSDEPLSSRLVALLARLAVELADQGEAIGELEHITT